jgi:hypothetical protein|tara:strand:- start:128 stop:571 length:444 start_codon:yes stop_codon:yes gene_type:complete
MPKVGTFIHRTKKTGLSVAYNNSFSTSKSVVLSLNDTDKRAGYGSPGKVGGFFVGKLQLVRMRGAISGGTNNITIKATWDSTGREQILSPTVVLISADQLDVDGSGSHSITLLVDASVANDTDDFYLFVKTDTGTFTVSECECTWIE